MRKTDLVRFKEFFEKYGIEFKRATRPVSYSDETIETNQYFMTGEKVSCDIHEGTAWCFDNDGNFIIVEEGS